MGRFNWLGRSRTTHHFDQLEARSLLSAPTATFVSSEQTVDAWDVTIRYAAADGIDLSSIDGRDMGAVGPQGYAVLGRVADAPQVQPDGSVHVRYRLDAYWGHWSWVNTGTYLVGVAGGQVRSTGGDVNVDTGIASFWFVWSNAFQRLLSPTGSNASGAFEPQLNVEVDYLPAPWDASSARAMVDVVKPNGETERLEIESFSSWFEWVPRLRGTGQSEHVRLLGEHDTGVYRVYLVTHSGGVEHGQFLAAQFWMSFRGPHVELTNQEFTEQTYRVSVRYSDPQGIDPQSIGNNDLELAITRDVGTYTGNLQRAIPFQRTLPFALEGAPVLNQDGSVSATYVARPGGTTTWTLADRGGAQVRFRALSVWDRFGHAVEQKSIASREIESDRPAVYDIRLNWVTATEFEIEVRGMITTHEAFVPEYRIDHLFDPRTSLVGPGSVSPTATWTNWGWRTSGDLYWYMRTRFSLPAGATSFTSGEYQVWLSANAMRVNDVVLPPMMLGTIQLTF